MNPTGKKNIALSLRSVEEKDMKKLFLWRNHPEIRKYFFNNEPVVWDEHEKWFHDKINDPGSKIYIAIDKDRCIGTIRFENRGDIVKCSVMVDPDCIGHGYGTKIIALGTKKYLAQTQTSKGIIAEVRVDNIRSLKAFQKAGFITKYVTLAYSHRNGYFISQHESFEEME